MNQETSDMKKDVTDIVQAIAECNKGSAE